jgi:hypothetical protein
LLIAHAVGNFIARRLDVVASPEASPIFAQFAWCIARGKALPSTQAIYSPASPGLRSIKTNTAELASHFAWRMAEWTPGGFENDASDACGFDIDRIVSSVGL